MRRRYIVAKAPCTTCAEYSLCVPYSAEEVRFELTGPVRALLFSRQAHSTSLPLLHKVCTSIYLYDIIRLSMKYLGLDYGAKKIGIAISDERLSMAFPRDIIINDQKHIEYINHLCDQEEIKDIVIGKSIDFDKKDNSIEKNINAFIKILNKDKKYTIHRMDERMTTSLIATETRHLFQKKQTFKNFSKNAKAVRNNTKDDDAKVAALILQNFLDSKSKL